MCFSKNLLFLRDTVPLSLSNIASWSKEQLLDTLELLVHFNYPFTFMGRDTLQIQLVKHENDGNELSVVHTSYFSVMM